uniref:KIB1-4 beta-propeller domain-containing protein n=1 Tax=Oryza punctata TaxID=4537 RepID=A0A0E0KVJ6_ORYPU
MQRRRAKQSGRRQHCTSSSSLWCDLPDDLQRLPALGDRLRFAAVCRAWRAAERSHPRPSVPWLVAPGHRVSLHDAAIHRVPLSRRCSLDGDHGATVVCRGSFGNWLAMVPTSSPPPYQPFLLNPFTMAKRPCTQVVMSGADGGDGITVAAIARDDPRFVARLGKIFVCHLPGRKKKKKHSDDDYAWSDISRVFYVQDIVFLEGKLYAVTEADIEHYSHLPSYQWRWTHPDKQAPAFGRTRVLPGCLPRDGEVSRGFGKARVPDTGGRAAARYHTSRFKVYVVEEHDQLETWGCWRKKTRVRCHVIRPAAGAGKIREIQIWYVDDERNMVVTVAGGDGPVVAPFGQGGRISSSWALRSVQSYDMRTSCFRRYQQPHKPPPSSPPPPWECPSYYNASRRRTTTEDDDLAAADDGGAGHAVTVGFSVLHGDYLRFTQVGASVQEAKQMAAWAEAVTFLRSRFRSVLDGSPWSSIPHYYRSHVSEIEYDEDFDDDFDYADF